ncbi:hypothetical protein JR316_0000959 [Psilocybe cubensis]|uniref:Hyaluronan/mRNA-binding protein domain-containing protein n=2 Tax=Psilocybe cubensis TaxID=181762 RepID=A0A8H8CQS8_PSICU|nr:hypothetical protein JR316_0000959 [Psilocybe cubensis]KAH9486894.1 hypothetical protein JR316_0000959 [Psilocybe cubensis]
MSVVSKNPFALLDDDEVQSAPAPPKAESTPAPAPASRGQAQKSRGGPAARGGKYYARGGKPTSKDSTPVTEETEGQKKYEGREGGRGRGGRGGSRGGPRGRGRPFDRHSQTGKTDSDKKVHQSWGGDDGNAELKTEEAAAIDAVAESATNDWGTTGAADADAWGAPAADAAPADGDAKPEGRSRREREPEEEDNTLTLDQYLAQQKEKEAAAIPKLENTRQANDGADDVFKDAVVLTKDEEDAYFVGKGKAAPKARAKKEEKVYLEIDARFERPDRGAGRGRGGRGGDRGDRGRGSRGRGAPRGNRPNNGAPVVNVDDQTAFPSLS